MAESVKSCVEGYVEKETLRKLTHTASWAQKSIEKLSRTDYFCWQTNAALHGSASAKRKTSARLHGNAFSVRMFQTGLPRRAPPRASQIIYSKMVLKLLGAPLQHRSCPHQKMKQLKWVPNSAHIECS